MLSTICGNVQLAVMVKAYMGGQVAVSGRDVKLAKVEEKRKRKEEGRASDSGGELPRATCIETGAWRLLVGSTFYN
ncbi:hypothetical protein SDJN03_27320, partial [Cucurbita argyrosperma subsp. sororia]